MSVNETKAPLPEPAPLYPAYSQGYQPASFQVQADLGPQQQQQSFVNVPTENKQENRDKKEGKKKKDVELDDGDDLLPGINPGGIPDKHFNLDFEHCFTEHKSTKTFNQLYKVVGIVYKYTKLFIYHFFVILIGIPMAIVWAIVNGIVMFTIVWLWGPALKIIVLTVYAFSPAFTAPIQAMLAPLADVIARIFRQIRVRANINGSFMKNISPEHMA